MSESKAAATFRPDIEGLRAVSVLLVLLYHYFPAWIPGGYVGVDVFFVISGFLITHSLVHGSVPGVGFRRWVLAFWARRARRLMPNALLLLVVFAAGGVLLLSTYSVKRLGSDVFWSALYSANWLFVLRSIDYLAWDESQRSILLNFWSLAVEEQFYLVWPFLLFPLLRSGRCNRRLQLLGVALLATLSFGCMLWQSGRNLTLAFFSTPARAWELWIGAMLALALPAAGFCVGRAAPWLRALGLALVGGSAFTFSDATTHPGWVSLVPVVGAALLVAPLARQDGVPPASRSWLAWGVMQQIGARSYSIYLWHWPVLVFGTLLWPQRGALHQLVLLTVSFMLAECAYRGVELPMRYSVARGWSPRRVITAALLASCALACVGLSVRALGASDLRELFGRHPARGTLKLPPVNTISADLPVVYRNGCQLPIEAETSPPCLFGQPDGRDAVVLFGDSHAAQWFSALDAAAKAEGVRFYSFTKSSCPSVDAPVWNSVARRAFVQCDAWRESALRRIEALAPRWVIVSNLVEPSPAVVDRRTGEPLHGRDAAQAWAAALAVTLNRLQAAGIHAIVIRDIPRPRPDILDCLFGASSPDYCELTVGQATATPPLDVLAARGAGAILWDFTTDICPDGTCPVLSPEGGVVYRDSNHLTDSHVRRLAPAVAARWQETLRQSVAPTRRPISREHR